MESDCLLNSGESMALVCFVRLGLERFLLLLLVVDGCFIDDGLSFAFDLCLRNMKKLSNVVSGYCSMMCTLTTTHLFFTFL